MPYGVPVQVKRPTGQNRFGAPTFAPEPWPTVEHCAIARDSTLELNDGQTTTVTVYSLYTDVVDADLQSDDVLVMPDGQEWQAQGDAWSPLNPIDGDQPGTTIDVKRVTG